ncbi:MAG: hypothetical protein EON59_02990 [Alphaproteobacteria bacterium]|nr:MAG: hypothetical protein EON59_02990 [Alphaproteobacteria bacterium]
MPKLKSVAFENYKAFAEPQTLEVRPITLLFGHNSVGKSAALRLLPILSDAARTRASVSYSPTVLDYGAPALRGAALADISHRASKTVAMTFALEWDVGRFVFNIRQAGAYNPVIRHELVSEFELMSGDDRLRATLTDPDAELFDLSDGGTAVIPFDGLRPRLAEPLASRFTLLLEALGSLGGAVHWLTAVRAQPPRRITLDPGGSAQIGADGEGTAAALWISALTGDGVSDAVSAWLKASCGCELSFAATDASVAIGKQWFPFQVRSGGAIVAVADVGEGVAQALPVVTVCRQAAAGLLGMSPVLALEQPELHLHPRAAASLAEEIVACVVDGSSAAHVIETHSEHFLLSLQVALLEKRLTQEQLLIYWVAHEDGESHVRRIEFDDRGYPSKGWPEGVFRETLEQARRIALLRNAG